MTDKEISFRSIIFLVIGLLLLLSLIICINIVNSDKDLVLISATVIDVKEDSEGTGKNDVTVSYMVDNTFYNYNFYYKDDIKVGETIDVYYHSKNVTSVQSYKTSKLIFVCPIIGLVLCVIGLFELFKKPKESYEDDDYKTKIISVVGNTEQLKIITDDTQEISYVKSETEVEEVGIKSINKESEIVPEEEIEIQTRSSKVENTENIDISKIDIIDDTSEKINEITAPITVAEETKEEAMEEETVVEKVKEEVDDKQEAINEAKKTSLMEALLNKKKKKVEVPVIEKNKEKTPEVEEAKEEVKEETKPVEKKAIEQKKIIPKKYYISGSTLVCELVGNAKKEVNFDEITSVVKTINSENKLVKITVCTDDSKCLLTNMYRIDLDEIANTIHSKMLDIKPGFEEEIEHKEY